MQMRFALLLCSFLIAPLAQAQPTSTSPSSQSSTLSDQWKFSVTPYAWGMGITGSISQNDNRLGEVKLTSSDVLSNLKMAAMLVFEARHGRVGLYLDGMYGDLGKTASRVVGNADLQANTSLQMTMLTLAPTYAFHDTPALRLDGLVGARFMWQNASTTFSIADAGLSLKESSNLQIGAAVAGVKGRYNFGNSGYYIPYYVDVGVGEKSSFTSQAYLGVGKSFDWGDVSLVAKNVYYQFKPQNNAVDLNMFGAAIAVSFKF
jgi:hypothetical protein